MLVQILEEHAAKMVRFCARKMRETCMLSGWGLVFTFSRKQILLEMDLP